MGIQSDVFEQMDRNLEAALEEAENDKARYHIRAAAQRMAIVEEEDLAATDDAVEEPAE